MIIVFFLLAINLAVIAWVVSKSCFSRQGIEFNHVLMFSFGFGFYWLVPIMVGAAHLFDTDIRMQLWYSIFDAIPVTTLILYLLMCLGCYLSFFFGGEWVRQRLSHKRQGYRKTFFYRNLLNLPLLIGTTLSAIFAVLLRDGLFKGYTAGFDVNDASSLVTRGATTIYGTFTATSVSLMPVALIYTLKRYEDSNWALTFRQAVLNKFFVSYFVFSVLVLSLGGREYFLCSVFMMLILRTVYFQPITRRQAVSFFAVTFSLAGLFGLIRQNDTISVEGALMNVFLEPLWTGFSLIHFLQAGIVEIIRFPIFLVTSFIDLIPYVLLPNKVSFIPDPADYGYLVFSPGGAENSFFSFMINFGVVGTLIALFFLGSFLSYLKVQDKTVMSRTIYIMLSGWLGFTFFREPFYISIIKTMFQFSYLEPIFLVLSLQAISTLILFNRRQRENRETAAPVQGG